MVGPFQFNLAMVTIVPTVTMKIKPEGIHECPDAEIAIWDASGKWYNFGSDTVKGYCSADEVATWIKFTADQGK
jgi:hypothetical protein